VDYRAFIFEKWKVWKASPKWGDSTWKFEDLIEFRDSRNKTMIRGSANALSSKKFRIIATSKGKELKSENVKVSEIIKGVEQAIALHGGYSGTSFVKSVRCVRCHTHLGPFAEGPHEPSCTISKEPHSRIESLWRELTGEEREMIRSEAREKGK